MTRGRAKGADGTSTGGADQGRRRLSRAAWGTAPAVLAAFAIINPGAQVSQVDLNDGTVWITNTLDLRLGRYNPVVEELNAGLIAGASEFDVLQDGLDVLLVQQGILAVVDPASVALAGQASIGAGTSVSMAGGTTAVARSTDGRVWARPTGAVGGLRVDADDPDVELGAGAAAVVTRDGDVLAVGPDGAVHRIRVTLTGNEVSSAGTLAGTIGHIDAITAVGGEVVVLSGTTVHTTSATVALPPEGLAVLQQPGPAADDVLVATQGALLEVPLGGGEPTVHEAGKGRPSEPVRVGGCAHGAWASSSSNYLRVCGDEVVAEDLAAVSSTDDLKFRVNRDVVVLNDVANGRVWMPTEDAEVREPNWTDIQEETEDEDEDTEQDAVSAETLQAECGADAAPPTAVDDEFGVRPGRTVILPVVDNDAASACGVLAIDRFDPIDESFGELTSVYGGRALQLDVAENAKGSTSTLYTVTDGRGSAAPATARVTITVREPGENGPPEQLRVGAFTVEQGGTATYDVLADFRDPDGDPMILVSAYGTGGSARARGDGRLRFQADSSALGRQTVTVVVSDGTESVEGTLYVDIRPAGSLPPVLEPVHVVTYVGEPATVRALDAVRSQGREQVRLAGVDEIPGLEIATDLNAGTFTVVGRTAGTFYVPYLVTAPPQQATGLARIDVLETPEQMPPPTAVLDVALLPPGGEVTIDPLVNDTDPTGGVLVVQDVRTPPGSALRVAVVDHHLVRIAATRTLEGPETLTYTITNGRDIAQGSIVVLPVPATAGQQPPVVPDATATVRTGAVVTIPVLEHAFDPDGDVLTLERTLVEPPAAGLMFVSGDVLRYQAPSTPMQVRATFEVSDSVGNRTAAVVTIDVHASDADGKAPPRPVDLVARTYAGEEVTIEVPLVGIDDDGDGVTLLGVDQPPLKGMVTAVGSDSLVYRALPGEIGTDTFTYAVEDWTGQRAVATVRVGIASRPSGAVPVITHDDAVTVRPGQTVEVRVLANDDGGGGGELTLDEQLTIQPEGVVARVEGRRVVVEAPDSEGVVQILYTARNDRGGYDTGVLTVTVLENAPFLPPVAADIVVPARDTISKTQVAVNVMETAQNPSGSLSDLAVEVPPSAAATAVAPGDGTVVITLVDHPQTLPYLLVNEHPDAGRVSSYAFITVPALGDFPPMVRPGDHDLQVIAGETLTIELAELVRVAPGRTPRVGDRTRVAATKSDGPPVIVDEDTLRYTPRADYSGPASITVHVADGPLNDPTTHDATLTFEISVLAREENPPIFTPSVLEVPQAATVRVDLTVFTSDPVGSGDDAASRYTYRLAGATPAGFDVTLNGSMLSVTAQTTTARGTVGAIPVEIGYGGASPLAVQVDARVVASREPLARVLDFTVPDGVEGADSTVRVLEGAFNPFAPSPLTVVAATVETPGAGSARVNGSTVVVSPASGYIGQMVVRYTVKDVLGDLDRMVEGRITVIVRGKPATPTAPRVVEVRDRAVALSWDAPTNNGEPIDSYRVTAVGTGIQQTCPSTACTITGLTNDVTYTFTVAAHNAVGWSDPSPPSGEARPDTQPLAPGAPRVERSDGTLTVSWNEPENPGSAITEYHIEITPSAGGQTTFTSRATSITLTGLENGRDYSVRVRAQNKAPQPGAWSPWSTGRPARVPDAPGNVSATRSFWGSSITVQWAAPWNGGEEITGYEVTVDGTVHTVGAHERQFTFEAQRGRWYSIHVRARNVVGLSQAAATNGQIFGEPGAVTSVTVEGTSSADTPPGGGQLRVRWQPVTETGGDGIGIRCYEVVVRDAGGAQVGGTPCVSGTEHVVSNLNGGAYNVTVTAVNTEDIRGPSVSASGSTITRPGTPELQGTTNADGSVTVTWNAVSAGGAAGVTYSWRVQGGPDWQSVGTGTSVTIPGPYADGQRLFITVRASNSVGASENTLDHLVEIPVTTPSE